MIQVSPELKAEIQKLRGRKLEARVRIDYSDVNLDNTIQATSSGTQEYTYIDQSYNGKEDVSLKWASLDGTWVIGEYALGPVTRAEQERYEVGWWADRLANYQGDYPTTDSVLYGERLYGESTYGEFTYPVYLKITFTERTISDLRISFDNARMEYAVDFDVEFADIDGNILYTAVINGNTGVKYVGTIPTQNLVACMTLIIRKWSAPQLQAKVAEFYTSVSELYNGDDIVGLDIIEERQPSTGGAVGSTSVGRCVVTLYNRNRRFDYDNTTSKVYNLVRENVRITPEIGAGIEWIPLGVYYAKAWDISKQSILATVTGVDRVALLNESEYLNSQIIDAPPDETKTIDSDGEWNAGTGVNTVVSGGKVALAYV
jgi:hypothetical protein